MQSIDEMKAERDELAKQIEQTKVEQNERWNKLTALERQIGYATKGTPAEKAFARWGCKQNLEYDSFIPGFRMGVDWLASWAKDYPDKDIELGRSEGLA